MTDPSPVAAPSARPAPWREWMTVIIIDMIVCGLVHAALTWAFIPPDLSWRRETYGTVAAVGNEVFEGLALGVFLAAFKFYLCPQHWVLLVSLLRGRSLRGIGARGVTLALLKSFGLAYLVTLVLLNLDTGGSPLSERLYELLRHHWLDWGDPLALIGPTYVLSCLLTGPIVAGLLARPR